jgi:hypothetical protein
LHGGLRRHDEKAQVPGIQPSREQITRNGIDSTDKPHLGGNPGRDGVHPSRYLRARSFNLSMNSHQPSERADSLFKKNAGWRWPNTRRPIGQPVKRPHACALCALLVMRPITSPAPPAIRPPRSRPGPPSPLRAQRPPQRKERSAQHRLRRNGQASVGAAPLS